jgi:hypothetical protein
MPERCGTEVTELRRGMLKVSISLDSWTLCDENQCENKNKKEEGSYHEVTLNVKVGIAS